jgi:hypothetical protein
MKIFLTYNEDFKNLGLNVENNLKKISGHRIVFHPDKADFILHLDYGTDDSFSPVMNKNDDILQGIGNTIVELFNSNRFKYTYTKMKDNNSDHKLLILNITQHGKKYDVDKYAELIAVGIAKFFNPEFTSTPESTNKLSGEKSYNDRVFTSNATSNSDLIFKKS